MKCDLESLASIERTVDFRIAPEGTAPRSLWKNFQKLYNSTKTNVINLVPKPLDIKNKKRYNNNSETNERCF